MAPALEENEIGARWAVLKWFIECDAAVRWVQYALSHSPPESHSHLRSTAHANYGDCESLLLDATSKLPGCPREAVEPRRVPWSREISVSP